MSHTPTRLILLLTLLLTLPGCGQKGPLYLPDEPATTEDQPEVTG